MKNKSDYKLSVKPVFTYYPSNRKTYFKTESRYVTQDEALSIICEANGEFEINGAKKAFFLHSLLSNLDIGKGDLDMMLRAAKAGGLVEYIKQLEARA